MSCYPGYSKRPYHPHPRPKPEPQCGQLPGTVLRLYIPAGATINLINLFEVTSPTGICLIVRIPILGGKGSDYYSSIVDAVSSAGGTVEVV